MEGTGLDNEFLSTRYGVLRVAHFVSIIIQQPTRSGSKSDHRL